MAAPTQQLDHTQSEEMERPPIASEGVAVEVAFGVLPEQERFAVAQPRPEHQNARERVLRRPREGRGHVLVETIR